MMALMSEVDLPTPNGAATFSETTAKARFGVAYLRTVCSQAGVGFTETSPDEDVLAVDGNVHFALADARVQIKCTGQFRINGGPTATWTAEVEWREKWQMSQVPVYFVLVIVDPDDQVKWLDHYDQGTVQRAAAFWTRVDTMSDTTRIRIPKSQRLTADTLQGWAEDLAVLFGLALRGDGDA